MTRLGIEPRSPGPLANTLPTRPVSRFILNISHLLTVRGGANEYYHFGLKVDLEVMPMKSYSILPSVPGLNIYNQTV